LLEPPEARYRRQIIYVSRLPKEFVASDVSERRIDVTASFHRRAIFSLPLLALVASEAHAEGMPRVVLAPLGPGVTPVELELLARSLRAFYAVDVQTLPAEPLPRVAYYPARGRYRAERLLAHLERRVPEGAFRLVGLTAADISTTKGRHVDWGILGLANLDGSVCVLSSFRCRRGAKSAAHARERFAKTAVHEVGHTFGLEHCPSARCLMRDGNGTVLTTDAEKQLCSKCTAQLSARGLARVPRGEPGF
jgi:archaemetzincin